MQVSTYTAHLYTAKYFPKMFTCLFTALHQGYSTLHIATDTNDSQLTRWGESFQCHMVTEKGYDIDDEKPDSLISQTVQMLRMYLRQCEMGASSSMTSCNRPFVSIRLSRLDRVQWPSGSPNHHTSERCSYTILLTRARCGKPLYY
jgi:hypothetical protein